MFYRYQVFRLRTANYNMKTFFDWNIPDDILYIMARPYKSFQQSLNDVDKQSSVQKFFVVNEMVYKQNSRQSTIVISTFLVKELSSLHKHVKEQNCILLNETWPSLLIQVFLLEAGIWPSYTCYTASVKLFVLSEHTGHFNTLTVSVVVNQFITYAKFSVRNVFLLFQALLKGRLI